MAAKRVAWAGRAKQGDAAQKRVADRCDIFLEPTTLCRMEHLAAGGFSGAQYGFLAVLRWEHGHEGAAITSWQTTITPVPVRASVRSGL